MPPPLLFAAALGAGFLIDGTPLGTRTAGHPSQWIGGAVALAGAVLVVATLGLFRRFRTRPEPWQPADALIATGLYRFSRNPMYLGMALLSAGIAILLESAAAAVLVAIVTVIIDRFVIEREEAYLARRFADAYAAYRQQVRRWL